MDHQPLQILYEDNHLLAVAKPAGLPTMGVQADRPSLLSLAKQDLKRRHGKPGNVYLGVVSRLDAPVTGVVLMARTSKAARRLNEQFRARSVEKVYWAVVEGRVRAAAGECVDWVGADQRHRRMRIVGPALAGAKEARLVFRRLQRLGQESLLEVRLETGRKHQIRLQMAHLGHPVLGDRKYGSRQRFSAGIALHARRLVFVHPVRRQPMELEAPLPPSWQALGIAEA